MNNFVCAGRLTKDPELRYTKDNKAVCNINIAINDGDNTTFLPITIFGKPAEATNRYCKKGSQIAVSGTIKNNNWKDKEDKTHFDYVFMANKTTFLSSKGNSTPEQENGLKEPKNELEQNIKDMDLAF